MKLNLAPTMLILVAGLSLAACNKSTADKQADAVRDTTGAAASSMNAQADVVENKGEAAGAAAADNAAATADSMRNSADAMKDTGEKKADAIEAGKMGATTSTDSTTTTTVPTKK